MEANFGGKPRPVGRPVVTDTKALGKKSKEWNLNDWDWDGDTFKATPVNSVPSDCTSRQLFPVGPHLSSNAEFSVSSSNGSDGGNGTRVAGKREAEKRRVVALGDEDLGNGLDSFNLNLGGQAYPIIDGDAKSWKKTKLAVAATSPNHSVCQVDDCSADLGRAKDYHRRHKVCELHSKASKASVRNVMQRFCQQCSRFHVLEEFDEEKRSCRRRLAGHNKRRRKTLPDSLVGGGSSSSNYLLISILRILSNMHSSTSDEAKHQDLLTHLLRNLASPPSSTNEKNILEQLQSSFGGVNVRTPLRNLENMNDITSNAAELARPSDSVSQRNDSASVLDPCRAMPQQGTATHSDSARTSEQMLSNIPDKSTFPFGVSVPDGVTEPKATDGKIRMNYIDLNCVYEDSQDCGENPKQACAPSKDEKGFLSCPLRVNPDHCISSSPQMSGNSDSTSNQSTSSSSGELQSRTDRIVFKLFGKNPNDFPVTLRSQILDWLSHSPIDIESYIRPGCIILTIYLRLDKATWEELCCNLNTNLRRLIDASNDPFWGTGWVYARVQDSVAFIYNGQVVFDTLLHFKSKKSCRISSIKPVAVCVSETAHFLVKGLDLKQSTTRLLCAMEGKYLLQKTCHELVEIENTVSGPGGLQHMSFSTPLPSFSGRGFIEVEDHALCGSFFPFLVVEKELCSEICTLEDAIEAAEAVHDISRTAKSMEIRDQALEFIHEMGWLLHRNQMNHRLGQLDPNSDLFPLKRFNWLIEFAMDHDWCTVVKKLLCIIFDGSIDMGDYTSIELVLLDMSLLHKAVSRNCRPMVELLLRFVPARVTDKTVSDKQRQFGDNNKGRIFRPDVVGLGGLTPLHVAASKVGSEDVLDALTDDPGLVGIEAWRNARDSAGLTPNDYSCLRGHYSYVQLVQRKISKKLECRHVVLNIPGPFQDQKQKPAVCKGLQLEKLDNKSMHQWCSTCEMKLAYRNNRTSLVYRPAMLSMVAIAAVCVCVALLFKSSPEVVYVFRPFRWEQLQYGSC